MLFELFVWITTLSNVYFIIVLTSNAIHKMLLYVQEVSPFRHIAFLGNIIDSGIFFVVFLSKRSTTVFLWTGLAVLFVIFNTLFILFFNCFK